MRQISLDLVVPKSSVHDIMKKFNETGEITLNRQGRVEENFCLLIDVNVKSLVIQKCILRQVHVTFNNKYQETLETHLLPAMERWHPNGDGNFQHDNAPCHKAARIQNYLS